MSKIIKAGHVQPPALGDYDKLIGQDKGPEKASDAESSESDGCNKEFLKNAEADESNLKVRQTELEQLIKNANIGNQGDFYTSAEMRQQESEYL